MKWYSGSSIVVLANFCRRQPTLFSLFQLTHIETSGKAGRHELLLKNCDWANTVHQIATGAHPTPKFT